MGPTGRAVPHTRTDRVGRALRYGPKATSDAAVRLVPPTEVGRRTTLGGGTGGWYEGDANVPTASGHSRTQESGEKGRLSGGADRTAADAQGRALPDAEIVFQRHTTFGWLEVARLTTGANGSTRIVLPVIAGSRIEVMAVATVRERTISTTARVATGSVRSPQFRPGEAELGAFSSQPGFISPYPPGRLLLTLAPLLAGIWVTYAVVVYQLCGIIRNR